MNTDFNRAFAKLFETGDWKVGGTQKTNDYVDGNFYEDDRIDKSVGAEPVRYDEPKKMNEEELMTALDALVNFQADDYVEDEYDGDGTSVPESPFVSQVTMSVNVEGSVNGLSDGLYLQAFDSSKMHIKEALLRLQDFLTGPMGYSILEGGRLAVVDEDGNIVWKAFERG